MATRFKTARLDKIKQILKEKKQIDVSQLSSILSVSEVTVRSYLEMLEQEGFVIRTHGGAILNEAKPPVLPFSAAAQLNEDLTDQELIADIALHHIKEGDVIAYVESNKVCAEVKSPAQGKVTNIRDYLIHLPEDMGEIPETYPLITIKQDKNKTNLMTEDEYKNFCKE
jgi:DeoR/GlpR family transcriptional regulator of sugar metabolism